MKVGCARTDITPEAEKVGMLGYGVPHHIVQDIHTRLYCRAFCIEPSAPDQPLLLLAVAEIGFITPILKKKVLERLAETRPESAVGDEQLMLLAQHTHSAPGGFSYHPFYNVSTPGLQPAILEHYACTIADALAEARERRTEGTIRWGTGEMDPELQVAFNRSLPAYNANKDVVPLEEDQRHLAVNRTMSMLQFRDAKDRLLGSLNWYAVHTTSMPNTSLKVHSDNKGYAALYLEDHHRDDEGYVGAFAQGHAGDVTPNFIYDERRKYNRYRNGPYADHDRNALFNGRIQYEKALEVEQASATTTPMADRTDAVLRWRRMDRIDIDPKYTDGVEDACTSPSCMGVDMFIGTMTDGIGFPDAVVPLARSLSKGVAAYETNIARFFTGERAEALRRKYKAQGVKDILMETGENRLFGTADIKNFIMPGAVDKTVQWIKYFARRGAFDTVAMTPQVLPFQLFRIGSLALASIPFEITTVAGRRFEAHLLEQLAGDGIDTVLLCPYANAFNGYITTYEEYQLQCYESGHNVFGQWSLAAICQIADGLCGQLRRPARERTDDSDVLPYPAEADLEKLMYGN